MGRAPCCDRDGLKKGPWTPEEDQKLIEYIQEHGQGSWRTLPKKAGLARCGKSCRLRWTNYLRPDIKRGRFSFEEEETIIQLHGMLGNKWSAIAARLPGRTDNEIKNYWNTHIRKRLLKMGIDPVTHSPRLDLLDLSSLFASPFCNPAPAALSPLQLDFSRILAGLDGDLLLMATNLILSQYQNPNLMLSSDQGIIPLPDQQQQLLDQFPPQQNFDEAQWTQCSIASELQAGSNSSPWQSGDVIAQSTGNNLMPDQSSSLAHLVNASYVFGANDSGQQSYWSTPASSSLTPLNSQSTTTYVNSSAEDEMESYCSGGLFHFQIPDDVSNPIL